MSRSGSPGVTQCPLASPIHGCRSPPRGSHDATCFPSPGEPTASLATGTGSASIAGRWRAGSKSPSPASAHRNPRRARRARRGRSSRGPAVGLSRDERDQPHQPAGRRRRDHGEQRCGRAAVALPACCQPTPTARSTSPPRRSAAAGVPGREGRVPADAESTPARARRRHGAVSLRRRERSRVASTPRRRVNLGAIGKGYAVQRDWRRAAGASGVRRRAGLGRPAAAILAIGGTGRRLERSTSRPRLDDRRVLARLRLRNGARRHQRRRRAVRRGRRPPLRPRPRSAHRPARVRRRRAPPSSRADAATADALATAFFVGGIDLAHGVLRRAPGHARAPHPGRPALSVHAFSARYRGAARGGRCEPDT